MELFHRKSKINYARLRVEICENIKQVIEYLLKIENMFLEKFSDKELNNFPFNYNTPESKLEKALFLLALIHPLYQNSKIELKEFHSLIETIYTFSSSKQIKKRLSSIGFSSKTDYLNKRLNFYMTEIKLFSKMENPNSGKITYFWYQNPISFIEDTDKNIFILSFFTNMVWGEFLSLFKKNVQNMIKKYLEQDVNLK